MIVGGVCALILLSIFGSMGGFIIYLNSIEIDAENFQKEGNYTTEELLLFSDIAFPYERIRKWEEDIKVEIKNMDKLKPVDIFEVDSIINILSPLISPVKMYRVADGGNLIVHRRVDSIPIQETRISGFCYIPPLIKSRTLAINYAEVYDMVYLTMPNVCLHEFEHAIGLQHPSIQYPFYMNIAGEYTFNSLEDWEAAAYPFYISEEEKKIIRMLYSPYIKSGLTKKTFMKRMGLNEDK